MGSSLRAFDLIIRSIAEAFIATFAILHISKVTLILQSENADRILS